MFNIAITMIPNMANIISFNVIKFFNYSLADLRFYIESTSFIIVSDC